MSGFQKRMRLNLIVMLFVIPGCWVSVAIGDSCPVSPSTVEIVDGCPDNEGGWREAAARKNCSAYASLCDEPEKLMYHCVINAFVNETLEVCAYRRNIVFGYCTEYSLGGNIIQQSFRANCTQFTNNPCPHGYQSTDAYKYPGCYELTKKTTATSTLSTTNVTHMKNEKQADGGSSIDIILPVVLVVVLLLIVVLGMYLIFKCKKEKCSFFRKKDHKMRFEEDIISLEVTKTADAETDHNLPLKDHLEEDPEQECQRLVDRINDGLTGLAIIHSKSSNADNHFNLANLHHGNEYPGLSFSQESTYLAQAQSMVHYFEKQ